MLWCSHMVVSREPTERKMKTFRGFFLPQETYFIFCFSQFLIFGMVFCLDSDSFDMSQRMVHQEGRKKLNSSVSHSLSGKPEVMSSVPQYKKKKRERKIIQVRTTEIHPDMPLRLYNPTVPVRDKERYQPVRLHGGPSAYPLSAHLQSCSFASILVPGTASFLPFHQQKPVTPS